MRKDALVQKAVELNQGPPEERLRQLAEHPAMEARLALRSLGIRLKEIGDTHAIELLETAYEPVMSALRSRIRDSGFSGQEESVLLAAHMQTPNPWQNNGS